MRGQAEIALIVGIVIVIVFVILYSLSSITPPSSDPTSLTSEQNAVEIYVNDLIERGSYQILDYIYSQGGYVNPVEHEDVRFVEYAGREVAYWQICQHLDIPEEAEIEQDFENGVFRYLENALPSERTDIAGKIVEFRVDEINVDANILQEKITLSVMLPTRVDGVLRDTTPYIVEIPSKLGRIRDFSEDFSFTQERQRVLDGNLLRKLEISNPDGTEDGDVWLPTFTLYMGDAITIDWNQVKARMTMLIDHTLSHTKFWVRNRLFNGAISEMETDYAYIPQIKDDSDPSGNSIQYLDLDVRLDYGGWNEELRKSGKNANEFRISSNPDPIRLEPLPLGLVTIPAYEDVEYEISFPVAVIVEDRLFGNDFVFMNFVNIRYDDGFNQGADCEIADLDEEITDTHELFCDGGDIPVKVTVSDYKDVPIRGAQLTYFGDCYYGWPTDNNGQIGYAGEMYVPSMNDEKLELYYSEGGTSSKHVICDVSSSDLQNGMEIEMPLMKPFDIQFYAVNIVVVGGRLVIANNGITRIRQSTWEQVDMTMKKNHGNCPVDDEMPEVSFSFKNYKFDEPDVGDVVDTDDPTNIPEPDDIPVENFDLGSPEIFGYISTIGEGDLESQIKLYITESYDLEINVNDFEGQVQSGKFVAEGFVLEGDQVYDKAASGANIIYVYVPKIVSGGYSEGDESRISNLYSLCDLDVISNLPKTHYSTQPGFIGCDDIS